MTQSLPDATPTPPSSEVKSPIPQNQPLSEDKSSLSKIIPVVVLVIVIIAGLALAAKLMRPQTPYPTPSSQTTKITTSSNSAIIASPVRSFQGIVASVSAQTIGVKNTAGSKAFTLASKFNVQKSASASAQGKFMASQPIDYSSLKVGQAVLLLVDKYTDKVVSIYIIK